MTMASKKSGLRYLALAVSICSLLLMGGGLEAQQKARSGVDKASASGDSEAVGGGYGMGRGPGILIAARGGYSLYLNGERLAEEKKGGSVRFVPVTFLPGANVIGIVAHKGASGPGLLMQIDELERTYGSGTHWKTSTNPPGDWMDGSFDDSGWKNAIEAGAPSRRQLPGVPAEVLDDSARWIWSAGSGDSTVTMRFSFTIRAQGFAEKVTGGAGGQVVTARTVDEFLEHIGSPDPMTLLIPEGVHDFRVQKKVMAAANPNDPEDPSKGVTFRIPTGDGFGRAPGAEMVETATWDRLIWVAGNKSIIGMGRGAHLRGASFYVRHPASNVIFRNLAIYDVNPHVVEAGDGIQGVDVDGLWVDHCTFRWISDGNDIHGRKGSKRVTFSWVHYDGDKSPVSPPDHYATAVGNSEVTYHHVWWDTVNGRAPKCDGDRARVHIFNNLYTNNTYFEVGAGGGAQVLLEGSVFRDVRFPTARGSGGLIHGRANLYEDISAGHQLDWKTVPEPKDEVFEPPYEYTLDQADSVEAMLRERAGVGGRWGEPPSY